MLTRDRHVLGGIRTRNPLSERDRQQVPWRKDIHDERLEGWSDTQMHTELAAVNMLESRKLRT